METAREDGCEKGGMVCEEIRCEIFFIKHDFCYHGLNIRDLIDLIY